jgi:hypothetical protein
MAIDRTHGRRSQAHRPRAEGPDPRLHRETGTYGRETGADDPPPAPTPRLPRETRPYAIKATEAPAEAHTSGAGGRGPGAGGRGPGAGGRGPGAGGRGPGKVSRGQLRWPQSPNAATRAAPCCRPGAEPPPHERFSQEQSSRRRRSRQLRSLGVTSRVSARPLTRRPAQTGKSRGTCRGMIRLLHPAGFSSATRAPLSFGDEHF